MTPPLEAGRALDVRIATEVMGTTGIRPITVIDHRGAHPEPGTASAPYMMRESFPLMVCRAALAAVGSPSSPAPKSGESS